MWSFGAMLVEALAGTPLCMVLQRPDVAVAQEQAAVVVTELMTRLGSRQRPLQRPCKKLRGVDRRRPAQLYCGQLRSTAGCAYLVERPDSMPSTTGRHSKSLEGGRGCLFAVAWLPPPHDSNHSSVRRRLHGRERRCCEHVGQAPAAPPARRRPRGETGSRAARSAPEGGAPHGAAHGGGAYGAAHGG